LIAAKQAADVAIVSSANSEAVLDEWTRYGLAPYVDIMLGQEAGTKAYAIKQLKDFGYDGEHVF